MSASPANHAAVRVERLIPAPPGQVYRAWLDPELLRLYGTPALGTPPPRIAWGVAVLATAAGAIRFAAARPGPATGTGGEERMSPPGSMRPGGVPAGFSGRDRPGWRRRS